MPTKTIRVLLFLSSYFPLWLILGILFFSKSWLITALCVLLGLLSLLGLWSYLRRCRRRHQHKFTRLLNYRRRDNEVMSYLVSYVVPFATFSLSTVPQILTLVIFLLVLLVLYVNSNMIYINPMLNIAGYHLYEIEVENSKYSLYYLARKRLARAEPIDYVHISDEIWLEIKQEHVSP